MKRINPLYLALLLIVVLLFLSIKLSNVKDELVETKEEYKSKSLVASQLSGLKVIYYDKEKVKASFDAILKLPSLKSSNIEKEMKKDGVFLSSESMDKHELDILMDKLLNGTYRISSLKIKKQSDTKVCFKMEIKW